METYTTRTLADRAGAAARITRALGNNPAEWSLDDLQHLDRLERIIHELRGRAINGLRETGHTDGQIAAALGVTQQAVSKRWPGGRRYVGAAGRYRKPTPTRGD